MDFMLTEQQQMMKKLFAEFAEKDVKPLAAEVDEDERFKLYSCSRRIK